MEIYVVYHGCRVGVDKMDFLTEPEVDVALGSETFTKVIENNKLFYIVEN